MKTIHFDKEYTIVGEHLNIDSIGVRKALVLDKYLIVETYQQNCFTKIYDLSSLNFLGDFLCRGQGPADVLYAQLEYAKSPSLYIEDLNSKSIKIVEIFETMNDGSLRLSVSIKNTLKYRDGSFADAEKALYVNDTLLWVKSYDAMDKEMMYYCKYNPVKKEITDKIPLYNYPVTPEIRYQKMITLFDFIKPDGSKIVSTIGSLDQLDIYNLVEPDKSISVTQNDHLFDYEYIKYNENMWDFYFAQPYCSDNLIFALYRSPANNVVEVHVIDWDGNPVCKLILDRMIKSLTVDFDAGFMYGVSSIEDRTYRYDIRNILKEVH
ncbi:MAG: TolB-like 6-bladed beta-propeller domain-containing protein [Prevotellaceae bacterium]|nr:TolB-like 6-bladed beta-propeller domain-containing protein [Prevotellaceae bacterium]